MRQLTDREIDVLEMIADRLTVKEMAARQGVSISAINKRISTLKALLGANTHRELAEKFAEHAQFRPYTQSACTTNPLTLDQPRADRLMADDEGSVAVFRDSMTFERSLPWQGLTEPQIVPRLLDGEHAVWFRMFTILGLTMLILVTVMIGLGVAQGITEALHGVGTDPREHSSRTRT